MTSPDRARTTSRRRRWVWVLTSVGVVLVLAQAALGWMAWETWTWGRQLDQDQALLPGTTVAGVDVSEQPVAAADALLRPGVDERLDRPIRLEHGDRSWTVTPRELDARDDLPEVLARAQAAVGSTAFRELARMRWQGADANLDFDVTLTQSPEAVDELVARLADEIDLDSVEAELTLVGTQPELRESVTGARLEQPTAAELVLAALGDEQLGVVTLPVEVLEPKVTTELAAAALPEIQTAIDAALDRPVQVSAGERRWTVTGRDLGAQPDIGPAVAALVDLGRSTPASDDGADALASRTPTRAVEPVVTPVARVTPVTTMTPVPVEDGGAALSADDLEVPLSLDSDDPVRALVAEIAAELDVPARDAGMYLDGGWVRWTAERTGVAVDRDATTAAIREAVLAGRDTVDVATRTVSPAVTSASLPRQVLLVRQGDRTVYLYEGGEIVRTWPAAIGTSDYPTPTGRFTVGTKRFEPVWVNPAPDDWGAGAPASIGPGPYNPLGPRAVNWNRPSGRDSLIRFHGTPDEDTVGEAATHGCVRMFNADVIELYDRVPTGTPIFSVP